MKKNLKNQKPIDIEAHFKYRCKNPDCGFDHWISLVQSQTKDFIIVCDCGSKIKPKRIKSLEIVYKEDSVSEKQNLVPEVPKDIPKNTDIPQSLLEASTRIMIGFGFTESESVSLLTEAFKNNQIQNAKDLVKYTISNIGATA